MNRLMEPFKQYENKPTRLETITLKDKLMLSVILRSGFDASSNVYVPRSSYKKKLFPRDSYLPHVIENLTNKGILYPKDVYSSSLQTNYEKLDFTQMTYKLNIDTTEIGLSELVVKLIYLDRNEFINDDDFIESIWGLLFQEEVITCIKYRLKEVKMYCTFTENVVLRIRPYVGICSISEMFAYVYYMVRAIVYYKAQGHFDSRNCESYVLNEIDRQYNKVHNQMYQKQEFSRTSELTESILFEVFFGRILKIDSRGFKISLNEFMRNRENSSSDLEVV